MRITQSGFTACELRRNVSDISRCYMILLNGFIESTDLLSIVGFKTQNHYLRKSHFIKTTTITYTVPHFFPQELFLYRYNLIARSHRLIFHMPRDSTVHIQL